MFKTIVIIGGSKSEYVHKTYRAAFKHYYGYAYSAQENYGMCSYEFMIINAKTGELLFHEYQP